MVTTRESDDNLTIILSPNRSASWTQSRVLLLVLGSFVMLVAIAWSFVGAWIVLPFAGLEVMLLTVLMYKVSYATYRKQIITIGKDHIEVTSGVYQPRQRLAFARQHTHLVVEEQESQWHLPSLTLTSPKQRLVVGEFLNRNDKLAVKQCFKQAGVFVKSNRWWKN